MDYKRLFIPNSLLFITIVVKYRQNILVQNITYLRQAFIEAKSWNPFDIVAIVVNQDHIHMIIKPQDIQTYPRIIANIKGTFTKISPLPYSVNKRGEANIWQRRYWEHTIRNKEELYRYIDYIHYNPFKHYGISPNNWPYSSFHKFVQAGYYELNWCNAEDTYHIRDLNLE